MVHALLAAAFTWPTPLPTAAPLPRPTVFWDGPPAVRFGVDTRPLGLSPDGTMQTLVRARFYAAGGAVTRARRGTDLDWVPDRGDAQWQTRMRFGGPAAIVSVREEGPVVVHIRANRPAAGSAVARFTTRGAPGPRVAAGAIGPHLVRVGWFPRTRAPLTVERLGSGGSVERRAEVRAGTSSWDDDAPLPGSVVRYRVGGRGVTAALRVPDEMPPETADLVRGKGAWLAFSGDARDEDGFARLDTAGIVATARAAGLRYIELRLAYGAFDEVTPAARATIDRLIDGLDAAGIAVLAWTVPRATTFEDLAATVAAGRYRTATGHHVRGLAVDLERGEEFLGSGTAGFAALRSYLAVIRRAVGPRTLLMATVEDPFLEHLTSADIPYAEIAAAANVMQPMTYWRMLGKTFTTPERAAEAVRGSVMALRAFSRSAVPISVGLQTTPLSVRGAPPGPELIAATEAARAAGAIGIAYYDWNGTEPSQWGALAGVAW